MANEQKIKNNPEQQTRALPKNFRQIGDPGQRKFIWKIMYIHI